MNSPNQNQSSIPVKRGVVDSINIYEITENELETLEAATPTGILFDIGLFCLSAAIAFTITLCTTSIDSERMFNTFLVVTIVGYLSFLAFLIIWLASRKSVKETTKKVRDRMNPKKNIAGDADSTE